MSTTARSSSGGIGLPGVLLCIFVTLKLCGVIDWTWWWVLSPIWITAAIVLPIVALCLGMWWWTKR